MLSRSGVHAAEADADVRCVVLTGAGERASARAGTSEAMLGMEVGHVRGRALTLRSRYLDGIHRVPRRVARFEKPIVVALNGAAIGAGLDLACMGDVRIASRDARLALPSSSWGWFPVTAAPSCLPASSAFARSGADADGAPDL